MGENRYYWAIFSPISPIMIIDGRAIAITILEGLKQKIHALPRPPKLMVVLVGDNPASLSYIRQKRKYATLVDMDFELRQLPIETSEQELLDIIHKLNTDGTVDGFLIQLPLPKHMDTAKVVEALDPRKDVDGFTSENIGRLFLGTADLLSCTPKGIMKMLEHEKTDLSGKRVTIIGRSNLVGKPLSLLMINAGATVTVCNSKTKDIGDYTKASDIVIVAAGSPGLLKVEMITP